MNVKKLIKLLEKYNKHSEVWIYEKGSIYEFPIKSISNDAINNIVILNGEGN